MEGFKELLYSEKIYNYTQIAEILKRCRTYFRFSCVNTKHKYFNVPAAFDIESSSFYDHNGKKTGLMYCWTFGIYGLVIFGRTWEQFVSMLQDLSAALDLNENKRLIVYVHNLQFDFQFFRTHFDFLKVFSVDNRKPLYALTETGIEFRCSYLLSGYGLATLGKNLLTYKVQKAVGDLDYNLIRHSETVMTKKEIDYCIKDVKVVMAYIAEEIDRTRSGIAELPYTKTGFARNFTRNSCFYEPGKPRKGSKKRLKYMDRIKLCTLTPELYRSLRDGFAGGYCHANSIYSCRPEPLTHVRKKDRTSAYPTEMLANPFPTGTPKKINCKFLSQSQFYELLDLYHCLFTIRFYNLREKPNVFENYISRSKCLECENPVINNGRLVSSDIATITITEVDFKVIKQLYDYDFFQVFNLWTWVKAYLPKDFILAVLKLYGDKTTLKGVEGKETEYQVAKSLLNALYGMAVTSIIRPEYIYTDRWEDPIKPDEEKAIDKYNKSHNRFLYYPWGVWITAYARASLFATIYALGEDYIYSDTDSVAYLNPEAHEDIFIQENERITRKMEKTLKYYDLDPELLKPLTAKGEAAPLGIWADEGICDKFKTLGAKRYMVEKNGELSLTVSGLNKNVTIPHLKERFADNNIIFEFFKHGLYIPAEYTGKNTHTYIDDLREGIISDYTGKTAEYHEKSGIHLEPADYTLSITGGYHDFLVDKMKGLNNGKK